jgi:hypothetical protein
VPLQVALKYKNIEEGHFLKARELILEIEGVRHNEFLQHDIRVQCLKRALNRFNSEIEQVAERFKNFKSGAYLWLYTPDALRGEELEGLYRLYYLVEIVKYLHYENQLELLAVEAPLSKQLRGFLTDAGVKLKVQHFSCFKSRLIATIQVFKMAYKVMRFNLKCLVRKPNKYFKGVLVDSSPNFNNNRYDDIAKVACLYGNVKYYAAQHAFVCGIDEEETVVFKKEINLNIILLALLSALKILVFIKRNRQEMSPGVFYYLNRFKNLILYTDLVIIERCIEKYLDKCDIQKILQVSTLTIPSHRLLISIARKEGIQFINIASRTYGPYECSDMLLEPDIKGYNGTWLPDWFILKDRYSFEKVFERWPQLNDHVLIGGRHVGENAQPEFERQTLSPALLILFNHKKDLSNRVLHEVIKSGLASQVETIIYRCHHIFVFEEEVIRAAFPDNKIINITGKDYSVLNQYRVVTVCGPTTAAMEVIQVGAIVLWAPWVWDESIIIDDVMRSVGVLNQSLPELTRNAQAFLTDVDIFMKQYQKDKQYCEHFFNTKSTISDQLKKIEELEKTRM